MEIKAKLTNSANAVATTKIDTDSIAKKVDDLAKKAAKSLKIDGFRKGKVPVAAVLKRYGTQLTQDAKQELFKSIIDESLKILNKKPDEIIGEPVFSKYDEKDGNIDVEMEISFRPDVNIDGYEALIPDCPTPRITKKEIEDEINKILFMLAPLEKSRKETLEKGDFAKFDFKGFVDGEAFEGGEAKDYVLEIGSNQFIPGFEDGMIGIKVGEERDIAVKFPAEYGAKHLAGKDATFKVTLHEIQVKKPATELDEESLKRIIPNEEKPTKEKLENTIKEQLRNDKLRKKIDEELKPKMADALADKYKFDLPKAIVEQEMNLQFNNAWRTFDEKTIEEFKKNRDAVEKKREEYREQAEKSVKITFLIDALAKARGIDVSDQELIQAIYFEAYSNGIDPKAHLEQYRSQGVLPAVKMALIEEKLFNDIFTKNKDEKEGE